MPEEKTDQEELKRKETEKKEREEIKVLIEDLDANKSQINYYVSSTRLSPDFTAVLEQLEPLEKVLWQLQEKVGGEPGYLNAVLNEITNLQGTIESHFADQKGAKAIDIQRARLELIRAINAFRGFCLALPEVRQRIAPAGEVLRPPLRIPNLPTRKEKYWMETKDLPVVSIPSEWSEKRNKSQVFDIYMYILRNRTRSVTGKEIDEKFKDYTDGQRRGALEFLDVGRYITRKIDVKTMVEGWFLGRRKPSNFKELEGAIEKEKRII